MTFPLYDNVFFTDSLAIMSLSYYRIAINGLISDSKMLSLFSTNLPLLLPLSNNCLRPAPFTKYTKVQCNAIIRLRKGNYDTSIHER